MYPVEAHPAGVGGVVGCGCGGGGGYCGTGALLEVLLVTRLETQAQQASSCATRGMVSDWVLYKQNSGLGSGISFCIAWEEESQRIIWTLLKYMPLDQICLINESSAILNEGNGISL